VDVSGSASPILLLGWRQDHRRHERAKLKLEIAEADERRIAKWRRFHPDDVAFWAAKKANRRERRVARREKMGRQRFIEGRLEGPSTIDENSDQWLNLILTSSESSGAGSRDDE
jgi:hypothetical protein